MTYIRINIYKAVCVENHPMICQTHGPDSQSIERAFSNACEDGWKMLSNRSAICPQCLKYLQDCNKTKVLNANN